MTQDSSALSMSVIAFHEKAGRSQVSSCAFLLDIVFLPPSRHCRHPSIRTLNERFIRSVQVGRSRFSQCCDLIIDLRFHLFDRSWARRLTQSPELGFGHCLPYCVKCLYAAADRVTRSRLCNGSYTSPLTHR